MSSKGTHLSEEAKERIAAAHRGKATTLGLKHTEAAKAKISEALKGREIPDEVRLKISNSNKGKVRSAEARKHISDGKKGKPHTKPHKKGYTFSWNVSDERRKEVADTYKGRKYTDESRLKMVKNHHIRYKLIIDGKQYDSIMEASRQLDIPYNRMRVLVKRPQQLKELFGIEITYIDE